MVPGTLALSRSRQNRTSTGVRRDLIRLSRGRPAGVISSAKARQVDRSAILDDA